MKRQGSTRQSNKLPGRITRKSKKELAVITDELSEHDLEPANESEGVRVAAPASAAAPAPVEAEVEETTPDSNEAAESEQEIITELKEDASSAQVHAKGEGGEDEDEDEVEDEDIDSLARPPVTAHGHGHDHDHEEEICIHMCAHRIAGVPCLASVILTDAAVEIRITDTSGNSSNRSGASPLAGQHVCLGMAHVSALHAAYMNPIDGSPAPLVASFWQALVRCVEAKHKHALVANTQALVRLTPVFCKDTTSGWLLLEEARHVQKMRRRHTITATATATEEEAEEEEEDELGPEELEEVTEVWLVKHVAHSDAPFDLEISVTLSAHSSEDLICTVPASFLRDRWARSMGVSLACLPGGRYEPQPQPVVPPLAPPPSLLRSLTQLVALHDDGDEISLYLPEMEHKKLIQYAHAFAVTKTGHQLIHDRLHHGQTHEPQRKAMAAAAVAPPHGGPKYRPHFRRISAAAAEKEHKLMLFQQRLQSRWKKGTVDENEERRKIQFSVQSSPLPQRNSDDDSDNEINANAPRVIEDAKDEAWDGSDLLAAAEVLLDPHNPYMYPTPHDILILTAALTAPPGAARLAVYCAAIETFLRFSELGKEDHLKLCSTADLRQLTETCSLKSFNTKLNQPERIAMANEAISNVFIVLQGTVLVGHQGAGSFMKSYSVGSLLGREALLDGCRMWEKDAVAQPAHVPITHGREHTAQIGRVIYNDDEPEEVHQDSNARLLHRHMPTLLLAIPLHLVLSTCGQVGPEAAEVLDYFWKFCRMHPLLLQEDFEPLFITPTTTAQPNMSVVLHSGEDNAVPTLRDARAREERESGERDGVQRFVGNDGKTDYVPADRHTPELRSDTNRTRVMRKVFSTALTSVTTAQVGKHVRARSTRRPNVIVGSRRRSFGAGKVVAEQGQPRHHLILIMSGECSVILRTRKFSKNNSSQDTKTDVATARGEAEAKAKASNNGSFVVETDTGLKLLAGDFWFCDGEDPGLWCDRLRCEVEEHILYPEGVFYLSRGLQVPVYGTHNHTLLAMTPVDIAVVPMTEISKNVDLFKRLLAESYLRYPSLHEHRTAPVNHGIHSRSTFKSRGNLPMDYGNSNNSSLTSALPEGRGNIAAKMYQLGIPSSQWPPPVPLPATDLQKAYLRKLRQATTSDYPIIPFKASSLPAFSRGKVIGFDAKGKALVKCYGIAAPMGVRQAQRYATATATATTTTIGPAAISVENKGIEDRDTDKVTKNVQPQVPSGSASRSKRPFNQRSIHM